RAGQGKVPHRPPRRPGPWARGGSRRAVRPPPGGHAGRRRGGRASVPAPPVPLPLPPKEEDMTTTSSRSPSGARGRRRSPVPDRVVELIRVPAGELVANPRNWRRHPQRQRAALRGILREIGYADALLARRHGDDLVLIDGHLRQSLDPDQVVPVLVLDVSAAEADTLLATLDPLAGLAQADGGALAELLGRVQTSSRAVQDLLHELAR